MNKTRVNAFCFVILMFAVVALAAPVPDTGQSKCYNNTVEIPCPSPGQPFYGQDANYTINPMSYTKLDGSGNALLDSATSWVMVRDNVTGLVWEMKTSKDGVKNYNDPHDADNTYTWYDSNPATNGGNPGTPGAGTDTEDFIKALNDARYGGYSDWRMPTIKELTYIVNCGISFSRPMIDTGYFPNAVSSFYWASTTSANNTNDAWGVNFSYGPDYGNYKSHSYYVRAVRGGWPLDHSIISVSPISRAVAKDAGATTFSVSNTGVGIMPWTAAVTSGDSWLLISSGTSGTDSGTITCGFTVNTSTSARTGTIRVTASGATGSPKDVTVIQAPTGCTATLDGNLMLHIPVLSYRNPVWAAPSFWTYFVYEYNPTYPALILFKMTNAGVITAPTFSCKTTEISTLSDDFKIHIPNVLLADGITRLSVDMEYSPAFSTNGNTYFVVTKYGVVPN